MDPRIEVQSSQIEDADEHLRTHLAYYRYECKFCVSEIINDDEDFDFVKDGNRVYLEFRCHFSKEFPNHLRKYHLMKKNENFVDKYVRRQLTNIPTLESLIEDYSENYSQN